MSERQQRRLENLADTLALRVQTLRSTGFLRETDTLLSLDYASQAAQAPYLFDMAGGILHRNHCPVVPDSSSSTLYALSDLREEDEKLACPICWPQLSADSRVPTNGTSEIFSGAMSYPNQFSSILRERRKDYHISHRESGLVAKAAKFISRLRHFCAGTKRSLTRLARSF